MIEEDDENNNSSKNFSKNNEAVSVVDDDVEETIVADNDATNMEALEALTPIIDGVNAGRLLEENEGNDDNKNELNTGNSNENSSFTSISTSFEEVNKIEDERPEFEDDESHLSTTKDEMTQEQAPMTEETRKTNDALGSKSATENAETISSMRTEGSLLISSNNIDEELPVVKKENEAATVNAKTEPSPPPQISREVETTPQTTKVTTTNNSTNRTVSLTSSTSKKKKEKAEEEESNFTAASQMAAVAAAALSTTRTESHKVVAEFARGLSATIATIPGNSSRQVPDKKFFSKVNLGLVRKELKELLLQEKEELAVQQVNNLDEPISSLTEKFDSLSNNEDETDKMTEKQTQDDTSTSSCQNNENKDINESKENVNSTTETSTNSTNSSQIKNDIASNGGTNKSIFRETQQQQSVIAARMAYGCNISFLQHILLLTYHIPIGSDVVVSNTSSRPTSPTTKSLLDISENPTLGKPVDTDDKDTVVPKETEEDRECARKAALEASILLKHAESSYDALLSMLSSLSSEALKYKLPGESEDEDSEYIPVVPDLLPPCISPKGDATSEFFQACSSTAPSIESPTKSSDKSKITIANAKAESDVGGDKLESTQCIKEKNSTSENNSQKQQQQSQQQTTSIASGPVSSIVNSVISSVKRNDNTKSNTGGTGLFGKRRQKKTEISPTETNNNEKEDNNKSMEIKKTVSDIENNHSNEYSVRIQREMLGLTVENVLERTVVRTVLANGAAKKAGAQVGSLIVQVGSVETTNLTHFETIDELRQSQRPLKLVLRKISKGALRRAREEMGRLIRGGGFGYVGGGLSKPFDDGNETSNIEHGWRKDNNNSSEKEHIHPALGEFWKTLHEIWLAKSKQGYQLGEFGVKEENLSKIGEKLVWILTLLVIGLEREASRSQSLVMESYDEEDYRSIDEKDSLDSLSLLSPPSSPNSPRKVLKSIPSTIMNSSSAKDYSDAARSVSKILNDYVQQHIEGEPIEKNESSASSTVLPISTPNRKRSKLPPPPPHVVAANHLRAAGSITNMGLGLGLPGQSKRNNPNNSNNRGSQSKPSAERTLLRIGDVLHRTRSFLADPLSPPSAILRGEVISLLCDILDIDTDMVLSEEENTSSVTGNKSSGAINDLGSAGSLLKLIVLNCSMTRSPVSTSTVNSESTCLDSHKYHAGNRFLAVVHRLAASRSTSARVTACSLGPVLWGHLDFPHQLQLRGVITRALHDVEVIVRKSTATVLHEIAELVFDHRAVPWLVLMCERAMTDPEPQLRAAAMTLTWHLAEHLPNAFYGDASKGSRSLRRLPPRSDPTFAEVYLLQCKLLPVATRLGEDRAPSVRLAVAAQCDRLSNALGEHWYSVIIDLLLALLVDVDERVRSEAILCVPRLVESVLLGTTDEAAPNAVTVLESLLPVAIKLIKDYSTSVRVSLATASGELLTLLVGLQSLDELNSQVDGSVEHSNTSLFIRHKRHIDDTLIPLVQRLLHDEDPEVTSSALRAVTNASRGNVREISNRQQRQRKLSSDNVTNIDDDTLSLSSHHSVERRDPVFIPVLSEQQVLRLLPTLSDLANSPKWRVRQSAVEIVPALLGCTHRLETRSEIAQLCITLMGDNVDAVRRTAAECLCLGGGSLGSHGNGEDGEWLNAIVIPHLQACTSSNKSKQRLLSLKMVEVLLTNGVLPLEANAKLHGLNQSLKISPGLNATGSSIAKSPIREILEMAGSLSSDRTVNVRLNVGRVMGNVVSVLDAEELMYIVRLMENQLDFELKQESGGDRDVIYFARRTLSSVQDRLGELGLSSI